MVTKCPRGIRLFFSYTVAWYTYHDACCSFLCGNFCASLRARAWGILTGMSRNATSKAHEETPVFSEGGKAFLWSAFLSGNSFFCARFCTAAWVWKGPFPVVASHHDPGRKNGFPSLCQPVAHTCNPKRNPAIFRFKICGFLRVAATTRRSLSGRTCRRSEPFSL